MVFLLCFIPRFPRSLTLVDSSNNRFSWLQLEQFAEKNKEHLTEAKREMQQVIEHATANVAWMEKNYDTIISWLEKQKG